MAILERLPAPVCDASHVDAVGMEPREAGTLASIPEGPEVARVQGKSVGLAAVREAFVEPPVTAATESMRRFLRGGLACRARLRRHLATPGLHARLSVALLRRLACTARFRRRLAFPCPFNPLPRPRTRGAPAGGAVLPHGRGLGGGKINGACWARVWDGAA